MAEYLLIPVHLRETLIRLLERALVDAHPASTQPLAVIRHAPTIALPEVHRFRDARGQAFELAAWSRIDAERRAEREGRHALPLTWEASYVPWPGCPSVNVLAPPEPEIGTGLRLPRPAETVEGQGQDAAVLAETTEPSWRAVGRRGG